MMTITTNISTNDSPLRHLVDGTLHQRFCISLSIAANPESPVRGFDIVGDGVPLPTEPTFGLPCCCKKVSDTLFRNVAIVESERKSLITGVSNDVASQKSRACVFKRLGAHDTDLARLIASIAHAFYIAESSLENRGIQTYLDRLLHFCAGSALPRPRSDLTFRRKPE